MSTQTQLDEKLAGCASANSLRMEASVAQILQKLRWSTVQGPYYNDPLTGKAREIDVVGQQLWRHSGSVPDRRSTIQFVVECKSIKGWHILFQPARPGG